MTPLRALVWCLLVLTSCGRTDLVTFEPPAVLDAGRLPMPNDAGARDAGADAGVDAGLGIDAGADSGIDAGLDSGVAIARRDLVYAHDEATLFAYEPSTGRVDRVASIACPLATDMAIDRQGRAFIVAEVTLFRFDPQTGACLAIAPLPESLVALTFLPAGVLGPGETLVGYGQTAYWSFDLVTGAATQLGSSSLSGDFVPSGDLTALSDGGVFLTVRELNGPNNRADELVRIDPRTGAVVRRMGSTGLSNIWGLATFDDVLYGFSAGGQVVRFAISNSGVQATTVAVSSVARRFWGAAAHPGAGSPDAGR